MQGLRVLRASVVNQTILSGWGRYPLVPGNEVVSEDLAAATKTASLTRGLGRSYGDSSLPARAGLTVANSTRADRLIAFNPKTRVLRAEAGLSLSEILRLFLPRGYFVPVTPGTQYVTLGGMVASDVHGKNHHREGCFGEHVTALTMRLASQRIVECSPTRERELFRATIGGMGLTGHILEVAFRMQAIASPWIWSESERVPSIEAYLDALKRAGPGWPFTVGWIDCLSRGATAGRGILIKGRWAERHEAPATPPPSKRRLAVPFTLPSFVLSRLSVRVFNELYFRKHPAGVRRGIVHPETFFYPLDMILHWNRIYGPRGFTQYQCVLPESAGRGAARAFLEIAARYQGASFLCVIKDCGKEGVGMLSFPKPGISIALDFPIRDDTQAMVDALNENVIRAGGRIYLTKDAFTRAEHFRAMEPRLPRFLVFRNKLDPKRAIRSAQSVRVFGDAA